LKKSIVCDIFRIKNIPFRKCYSGTSRMEEALWKKEEFKKIYLIIKESDPVIFPIMKKSLEEVKQMFDFE